jgi:hypothetical protein
MVKTACGSLNLLNFLNLPQPIICRLFSNIHPALFNASNIPSWKLETSPVSSNATTYYNWKPSPETRLFAATNGAS